jgi:hypothetical protein
MIKNFRTLVMAIVFMAGSPALGFAQQKAPVLQNQRELFVDNYLVDKFVNTETRLATPVSAGVAVQFDKPWEGNFAAYVSVTHADGKYKMYYRGLGEENGAKGEVTCYAESEDGINWKKPVLNLIEVHGSKANNVVAISGLQQSSHNFSVIYDSNPGTPASQRYKAVGGVASSLKRSARGLYRFVSPDGIHWNRLKEDTTALFRDGYGMDSQNVLAWLPAEKTYAIYLRTWTGDKPGDTKLLKGVRTIARSVSKDFIHWSEPVVMNFGNTPLEDLYTNATQPYFRAPHLLISMPFRFSPENRVLSDEEMKANGIEKSMWKGVSDAVLLTSRGGNVYDRKFMESFVRPGLDQRNWAARSTIPSLGVVPTGKDEMSFFVTRAYSTKGCYLERMKLRIDGFASLHAGYQEGHAVTRPLRLKGESFQLNYSTSSIGYVKVVLLDESGKELPGFGEADAEKISGDKIDIPVKWKSGMSIKSLGNRDVRIKFILRDADIFSLGIF